MCRLIERAIAASYCSVLEPQSGQADSRSRGGGVFKPWGLLRIPDLTRTGVMWVKFRPRYDGSG